MGVSKCNSEGYYDPVVYEALTRIEAEERAARAAAAYRPLVYICSPYAGDVEKNTFRARAFSRFAVERHCMSYTAINSFRERKKRFMTGSLISRSP